MDEEDLGSDVADREDGASGGSAAGEAEPCDPGGGGVPGGAGSAASGPDAGETAGKSGTGSGHFNRGDATVDGVKADGAAFKKKSIHASEQETPRVREQRTLWCELIAGIDPTRLIFVDETGLTTEMTRRYGRAMDGARGNEGVPAGRWSTLTLLGAVGLHGWVASMTVESATDGDVFLSFVEHVLCPNLQPGHSVVMDNLAAHKVDGVMELISAVGASVFYLPPYLPDFNPIEKCWAQLKQRLRTLKARSLPSLCLALDDALSILTPQNSHAYFQHCGYGL